MKNNMLFPFTAIAGQEELKLALILNLIDPKIGGVLIRGEKGTGKSTAVRSIETLNLDKEFMRVIELPINATEDRVVGSIDIESAIKKGEKEFQPGLLADADKNILYVDEINLLNDYIVDILLDSAAMGVNIVEREGISHSHPARFILIGTMNPEEGDLRPQLLDRFGLSVDVIGEDDPNMRIEIIKRRMAFEEDKPGFIKSYELETKKLSKKIIDSQNRLSRVKLPESILEIVVNLGIKLEVDGHRADITLIRAGKALAAYNGDEEVKPSHIERLVSMVYSHRLRRLPFEEIGQDKLELVKGSFYD